MNQANLVYIAKVVGAHGIRGDVKLQCFTDNVTDIKKLGTFYDKCGDKEYKIQIKGMIKSNVLARISGVEDRNCAEALVGTELYVPRASLPELKSEQFYHCDLIGLKAVLQDKEVGVVSAVYNFGAGDILEIQLSNSTETSMIPFNQNFVPQIDIKNGYIIISGLISDSGPEDED